MNGLMVQSTPHSAVGPIAPNLASLSENVVESKISIPPPVTSPGTRTHTRARTNIDLPPLFTRNTSVSPSRSSTFLPFLKPRDRSISPERVSPNEAAEFDIETRPTKDSLGISTQGNPKLASWFNGSSEPINITLVPSPTKETGDSFFDSTEMWRASSGAWSSVESLTQRLPSNGLKRPTMSKASSRNSSLGRFSFFRKSSLAQAKQASDFEDDLASLDVESALYPSGRTNDFSPVSFRTLESNARGTLQTFQNAYSEKLQVLKEVISEKNVQADELEAAQTRNEALKMQLSEMAERANKQEKSIEALRNELAAERKGRRNDEEAKHRSIRMVCEEAQNSYAYNRGWKSRRSEASSLADSESGCDVSSAESVFSDRVSGSCSPTTSAGASPVLKHIQMFDEGLQGSLRHSIERDTRGQRDEKIRGASSSDAWEVFNLMKVESMALKRRIAELEAAQDDALDFLSGLKL